MENETQATPMVNVWMVVFCTMLATGLFGFVWHTTGMSEARAADEKESQVVKEDIVRLTSYRDQLKEKMASTSTSTSATTTPPSALRQATSSKKL